jgi:hypothetical protein
MVFLFFSLFNGHLRGNERRIGTVEKPRGCPVMLHECEAIQCVVFDARVLFPPEAATKFTEESALDSWPTLQINSPTEQASFKSGC